MLDTGGTQIKSVKTNTREDGIYESFYNVKEIKSIILNFFKENSVPNNFTSIFYQTFKEDIANYIHKLFQRTV